jgi:CRISPR/Cas system-associated endonuclease Cas1
MRKRLNTLFVATEGAYLRRDGLNVVVEVERVEKLRVPLHLLSGVVVFGQVSLSLALMGSLAEAGVVTAFFGMNAAFWHAWKGWFPAKCKNFIRHAGYFRSRVKTLKGHRF